MCDLEIVKAVCFGEFCMKGDTCRHVEVSTRIVTEQLACGVQLCLGTHTHIPTPLINKLHGRPQLPQRLREREREAIFSL